MRTYKRVPLIKTGSQFPDKLNTFCEVFTLKSFKERFWTEQFNKKSLIFKEFFAQNVQNKQTMARLFLCKYVCVHRTLYLSFWPPKHKHDFLLIRTTVKIYNTTTSTSYDPVLRCYNELRKYLRVL